MANEDEVVTRELVESLAEKVDAFAASLTDRERDLFTAALQTYEQAAELDGDEVTGFGFDSPMAMRMGDKVGTAIPSGVSVRLFPSVEYGGTARIKTSGPIPGSTSRIKTSAPSL